MDNLFRERLSIIITGAHRYIRNLQTPLERAFNIYLVKCTCVRDIRGLSPIISFLHKSTLLVSKIFPPFLIQQTLIVN